VLQQQDIAAAALLYKGRYEGFLEVFSAVYQSSPKHT